MNTAPVNFWLRLGRLVLIAYAVLILAISITGAALFPAYAQVHAAEFTPNASWTAEQVQAGLVQLGWPITVPAFVELARTLLLLGIGIPMGLLLLWRRPASWFRLYLAFVFISFSLGEILFNPVLTLIPGMAVLGKFLGSSSWQFFFIMLYFFPNGQAVPGWSRWIAWIWLGLIAFSQVFGEITFLNGTGIYFALPIAAILSQIYRYFWRSDPLQRQQTKWVFSAVVLMLVFMGLVASWAFNPPTGPDYRASLVIALANLFLFSVMFSLFPLALAVAIFRYHLWDIDIIIQRTLAYGLLTFFLGLVYFGMVTILQALFVGLSGQQSPLTVVLSTLAIAALFTPLRRRIQQVIDRRFYRRKYNAEQAIERFTAASRAETDINHLTTELPAVVAETMQPESISLWLRPTMESRQRPQSNRDIKV